MPNLKTLKRGSRGTQVELLQLALRRYGAYSGNADGIFGGGTERAVRNFQMRNGLVSDGIAGPKTWSGLTPFLTGYRTYTVRSGDTFYKLAMRFGSSIRAIAAANPEADYLHLMPGTVLIIPLGFDVVPTDISFTSSVMEYCVTGLKARYPFVTTGRIGRSETGKDLYYFKIGTGDKQVFYNASHHANEWITTPMLLKFLEDYARSYVNGDKISGYQAAELYNKTSLYAVPLVNPDGVDLVTGELSSGENFDRAKEYAGRYPSIPFPDGWKANIRGVDLNLQYPAGWENAKEIKFSQGYTSPAPRDYVGAGPLSAPESRAVYDFTGSHDFRLTLSYHTQGRVLYWKYLDNAPQGAYEIAQRFADVSGYFLSETPYASGYAGYKDWFILQYGRPGYTVEAGLGTAPLPIGQFDRMYAENIGIMTLGLVLAP